MQPLLQFPYTSLNRIRNQPELNAKDTQQGPALPYHPALTSTDHILHKPLFVRDLKSVACNIQRLLVLNCSTLSSTCTPAGTQKPPSGDESLL